MRHKEKKLFLIKIVRWWMMIFKKPYYNYNKDLGDYFCSRSWKRANNYNVVRVSTIFSKIACIYYGQSHHHRITYRNHLIYLPVLMSHFSSEVNYYNFTGRQIFTIFSLIRNVLLLSFIISVIMSIWELLRRIKKKIMFDCLRLF